MVLLYATWLHFPSQRRKKGWAKFMGENTNRWTIWTIIVVIFLDCRCLKYKVIFNINSVKFLIIHVAIEFNGNHIKKYGWVSKNNGFRMDF